MQAEALSALLCQLYDPTSAADQKHHAEQQLNAFSNSLEGLEWALTCVQSPNVDPQQQFFAASVLEGAVARRWTQLPPAHQATLQSCLWMHITQPSTYSLLHFVTSKLRAALAQLACINWQHQFWADLQACLNNAATAEAGVRLLGATLEQLHSMAQGTASALSGKVLSSDLPEMQSRLHEAQIISFQMLCPPLQHMTSSSTSSGNGISNNLSAILATAPPGLAVATLDALRVAIATSNVEIFNTQSSMPGIELGLHLVTLLLPFLSLAAAEVVVSSVSASHPEAAAAAAAASFQNKATNTNQLIILGISCLEDLINRPHQPNLKQKMLAQSLPAISSVCRSWSGKTAASTSSPSCSLDSDLLGVFTRLLTQNLQHSFAFASSNPEIAAGVQDVLREVTNFAAAPVPGGGSGSGKVSLPIAILAAAEAWHTVLSRLEDLEASNWGEQDSFNDDIDTNNNKFSNAVVENKLSIFYKQGILHFSHLVVSIFFTKTTQQQHQHGLDLPAPPFLLQNLDTTTGSGAAIEDWVAAVGENNEEFQTDAKDYDGDDDNVDTTEDEGEYKLSISSEAHVFALQIEYFIAHATSSYNKELVPILFHQLAPALTEAAQARQQQPLDYAAFYLCNFRAEFALRLVARCAPYFPTNALTLHGNLEIEEKEERLSGGHVLQLTQALLQFGAEQLKYVHHEAQHAQHVQQRILIVSSIDTVVTIYRTLSPLMTTWLLQIMLTKAGTDHDVQLLVSQVLQALVEFVAAGIDTNIFLNKMNLNTGGSGSSGSGSTKLAISASQTLLSVTSIALSSGMKPPVALLQSITTAPACGNLATMVASCLHLGSQSSVLPRASLRSLVVSLSDLALRSWGAAVQASTVDINERKAALASFISPLLQVIQSAAQGTTDLSSFQVSLAASLATDIVESYLGSLKVVRGAVFEVFAQPMLTAVMPILTLWKNSINTIKSTTTTTVQGSGINGGIKTKNKLGTTLLNFISSCLRAFPAELGTASIGELLSALVAAFSTTTNNNPLAASSDSGGGINHIIRGHSEEKSLDADVVLLAIITSSLTQGGSKHATLVMPAMHFGLQLWDKAAACGATHVKAQVLASLLGIMAQHWRSLGGNSNSSTAGGGGGGGEITSTMSAATEAENQPPAAVVTTTLTHVSSFFSDAACTRAIPSASDVKLVLETLFDIQSRSKLFWKPYFSGWKDLTMESLLSMQILYTGAQESIIDILYQLAAANWSHFLLSFLPMFAEKQLSGLGVRGTELAAAFGTGDMESWAFEKSVVAFVNDAIYWEKRM